MKSFKKTFAALALGALTATGTASAENKEMTAGADQTVDEKLCVANTDRVPNGSKGVMDSVNALADKYKMSISLEAYSANSKYTFIKAETPHKTGHLLVNEDAETVCEVTAKTYNKFKPPAP